MNNTVGEAVEVIDVEEVDEIDPRTVGAMENQLYMFDEEKMRGVNDVVTELATKNYNRVVVQ